jgi:hypothetical protein
MKELKKCDGYSTMDAPIEVLTFMPGPETFSREGVNDIRQSL